MKALVKVQKGDGFVELRECPKPVPKADEVLIRVAYTGICGTDIHILHDQFSYWPPVILGHEFSGVIEETGDAVTGLKAGDRVVGEPHNLACGKCFLCRNGNIQICDSKRSIGWGIDGAFAPYLVMPEKLLHKVSDRISLKAAAMAEPCAIVAHQLLERTGVRPGDYVAVMGMGAIALIAAQMAKAAGASRVVMCGCESDTGVRLAAAERLGCCDRFIHVQKEDAAAVIYDETGNIGADVVVEASGAQFVKTCTGFSSGVAEPSDVALMKQHVTNGVKVKASAGIKTREKALEMIEAGADRLGTSSGTAILEG